MWVICPTTIDYSRHVVPGTRLKFGKRAFSVADPEHGTSCQQNSSWCVPRQFSSVPWKRSCSRLLTVAKAPWSHRDSGQQLWNRVTGSFGSPCGSGSVRVISFLLGSLVLVYPSFSNGSYVTSLPTSRVISLVRLLLADGRITANLCYTLPPGTGWVTG